MKAPGKYNLLFIHDDGATRSFRISRGAIRVFICILIVLPLLGAGGIWLGWQAWEHQAVWDQEERILQQELTGLRLQLDRLSHIEKLVKLHESGAGTEVALAPVANGEQAASAPATPVVPDEGPAAVEPAVVQTADNTPAGNEPETAQSGEVPPAGEDAVEFPVVNTGQVRLADVSVLLVDGRRLRVRMDLHNESGRQIAGKLLLFLLTSDGQRIELVHNDPTFKISRLKKFASTSVVPDNVIDLTNAMVMVEVVDSSSSLLSRQLYAIAE